MALLTPADITDWNAVGMDWSPPSSTNCRPLEWKYVEALRQATLERMEVHRSGTSEVGGINSSTPTSNRLRLIRRNILPTEVFPVPPDDRNPYGRDPLDGISYSNPQTIAPSTSGMVGAIDIAIRVMIGQADASFGGSFVDRRRNWAVPAAIGNYDATTGFPYLTKSAIENIIGEPIEFATCGSPSTYKWAYHMYRILNLMVHYGCRIQMAGGGLDPAAESTATVTKRPAGSWSNFVTGTGVDLPSALADLAANWNSASTSSFTPTGGSDNYAKSQTYAFFTTQVRANAQETVGAGCASVDIVPTSAAYAADVDYYSRSRRIGNNLIVGGSPRVFDNQAQDPTLSDVENRLTFLGTVPKIAGNRHCPSPKIGDISIAPDFCPTVGTTYGIEGGTRGLNALALPDDLSQTNIGIHRFDVVDGFRFQA